MIAYIDFQKAFDSVSHPKLLHKLSSYGINGNLYFWISAFLSNRLQQVKVGSSLSSSCQVTSGVPQGSVIGSLLFNLFVNDVTDHLNSTSTAKSFADDIKIYTELINHDSNPNFQAQLDLIHQWSVCWQLPLSHSKCNLLCLGRRKTNHGAKFTINDIPLATPNFITDLGVIVDPDLKFNVVLVKLLYEPSRELPLSIVVFLSRKVGNLVSAFKTYVRPILEYASQTWNPYLNYLIEQIESVQRSFTKRLPGFAKLTYAEKLINLNLQSLEHRRLLSDLAMCYNIVHGCCALRFDEFFTFSINPVTRGHSLKLTVPLCKSNIRKNIFATRVVPIWNSLPQQIVSANSPAAFKNQISKHDFSLFLNFPCIF